MEGGFVSANCSECGAKDKSNVTLDDVRDLNLWVSCPKCKSRMAAGKVGLSRSAV
jgi:NAD-dependent SIR2 family protein deacetylase